MNPLPLIKRLIFVPKCAACGERISPFPDRTIPTHGKVCLCNLCYKKWHEAMASLCNRCALPAYKCKCIPKLLDKSYSCIPSLCFYNPEGQDTQNNIIFSLKSTRNTELVFYLAYELYPYIAREIESRNISRDSLIFTWIPRRRSSVAKYGFDQGELLAKATAKLFGAQSLPLFLRFGGKEQKTLNPDERNVNLNKSVILNHTLSGFPHKEKRDDISAILEDKNVVIIDDIITTGSSMRRGIDLLNSVFNGQIIIASIAKVQNKRHSG